MYKRVQSMISFFRKKDIKINHHNKVKKIYFFNIYVIVYIIIFLFVLLVILFTKFNVKYVSIALVVLNKKKELGKDFREIEKNKNKKKSITKLILKDVDNYDLSIWDISQKQTLLIGKGENVDIDLSKNDFSYLVSRIHGVLNKVNDTWVYEDMESKNGSGIEKNDGIKQRLNSLVPYSLEYGDYLYIGTIKILMN